MKGKLYAEGHIILISQKHEVRAMMEGLARCYGYGENTLRCRKCKFGGMEYF